MELNKNKNMEKIYRKFNENIAVLNSSSDSEYSDNGTDLEYNSRVIQNNLLVDTVNFLVSHDAVAVENALEINKSMQKMLIKIKEKLEEMLEKCQLAYEKNEKVLTQKHLQITTRKAFTSFYVCGAPFFKDQELFAAPHNEDYLYRKNVLNELFPMDLQTRKVSYWTLKDKINIIQTVKRQVLDYLKHKKYNGKQTKSWKDISENEQTDAEIQFMENRLVELLEKAGDKFNIDWGKISEEDLNSRHEEKTIEAMWNMYLKPELSRSHWSSNENEKLLNLCLKYKYQDWENISKELGNRSEYQCIVQVQTVLLHSMNNRRRWTKDEDKLLIEAVEANRTGSFIMWNKVVTYFPHRSKNQIYTRYTCSLQPNIKKRNFTKKEDCIILAAIQEYGENFSKMPKSLFPNRTLTQVRNRYFNVLKHSVNHKVWTVEDDEILMNFIGINGPKFKEVAALLKNHTRTSCRTRYNTLKNYIEKNPGSTLNDVPRKKKKALADIHLDNWTEKIVELNLLENEDVCETRPRKRVKKPYYEAIRRLERNFYDFFKYSYDFKLNCLKEIPMENIENIIILCTILKVKLTDNTFELIQGRFHENDVKLLEKLYDKFIPVKNKFFKYRNDITLSPNLCTLLGLRAVSIHLKSESMLSQLKFDVIKYEDSEMKKIEAAKKRFKMRFISIFYKTALLSKIPSSMYQPIKNTYMICTDT